MTLKIGKMNFSQCLDVQPGEGCILPQGYILGPCYTKLWPKESLSASSGNLLDVQTPPKTLLH